MLLILGTLFTLLRRTRLGRVLLAPLPDCVLERKGFADWCLTLNNQLKNETTQPDNRSAGTPNMTSPIQAALGSSSVLEAKK